MKFLAGLRKFIGFVMSLASYVYLAERTMSYTDAAPDWLTLGIGVGTVSGLFFGANVWKEAVRLKNGNGK